MAVAAQRTDIAGLILESPFADYQRVISVHARLLGLPGGILLRAAIAAAKVLSGARFEKVGTVDLLKEVKCPVLTIVGDNDQLLDDADVDGLRQSTEQIPRSTFWLVENTEHLQAMARYSLEYQECVQNFIERV